MIGKIALCAALSLAVFAATAWWALEAGGVAVVSTARADGSLRETHVWYAELDGALWVEAGTPENPWYRDVQRTPTLRFTAEERSGHYHVHPDPDPARRRTLRSRLRAKYGWRDRFVGLLVDSEQSVPVRLEPVGAPPEPIL